MQVKRGHDIEGFWDRKRRRNIVEFHCRKSQDPSESSLNRDRYISLKMPAVMKVF
jgi:hypothetical protein